MSEKFRLLGMYTQNVAVYVMNEWNISNYDEHIGAFSRWECKSTENFNLFLIQSTFSPINSMHL